MNYDKRDIPFPAGPVQFGANHGFTIPKEGNDRNKNEDQRPVAEEQEESDDSCSDGGACNDVCDEDSVGDQGKQRDDGEGDGKQEHQVGQAMPTHRDDSDEAMYDLQKEKEREYAGDRQRPLFIIQSGYEVKGRNKGTHDGEGCIGAARRDNILSRGCWNDGGEEQK